MEPESWLFNKQQLSAQGHSVTNIDQSSEDIKKINDTQDVKGIVEELHYQLCLKMQEQKSWYGYCSY